MFGPHFYYDLVRLARNRRNVYLRSAYLLALLFAWWLAYEKSTPFAGHINDYARLATRFAESLLIVQFGTILLLAPIYLAGTIVEERQSRTLELLYQTQLTDREILLGKFAARVVHLAFFVLLNLPMLAIISLWGGVDMEFLATYFFFTLHLMLLISSICLWISVTTPGYTAAVFGAYIFSAIVGYLFGLLFFIIVIDVGRGELPPFWMQAILAIPFLGATAFFWTLARRSFGHLRDMKWMYEIRAPRPKAAATDKPSKQTPARPVPDQSLLWKEILQSKLTLQIGDVAFWAVAAIALGLGLLRWLLHPAEDLRVVLWLAFVWVAMPTFGLFAFQATAAVARERERNTLDFLLLLPMERREILFAKWLAPWLRAYVTFCILLVVPIIGIMFNIWSLRLGLVLLLAPWPMAFLVNSLGLLLSIVCRRVVTANLLLFVALGLVLLIHLAFWNWFEHLLQCYNHVFNELSHLKMHDPHEDMRVLIPIAIHLGILLLAGLLTLAAAFRLFERRTSEVRSMAG